MWNGGGHDSTGHALALGIALGAGDRIREQQREINNLRRLRKLDALKSEARELVSVTRQISAQRAAAAKADDEALLCAILHARAARKRSAV